MSRNDLSFLLRLGCFSLRSALASIWRMRSRVTLELLADFFERVVGVHADAEAYAELQIKMPLEVQPGAGWHSQCGGWECGRAPRNFDP